VTVGHSRITEGFDVNHTTDKDGCATLGLSKIGYIPIRAHREIPATEIIKRVVLEKQGTGDWFVCLVTERPDDDLPEKSDPSTLNPADCVGLDIGILSYIHTSDDTAVDMLDLSNEYDRYAHQQRKLDRKEHDSAN
jgi:putative transposase